MKACYIQNIEKAINMTLQSSELITSMQFHETWSGRLLPGEVGGPVEGVFGDS